MPIIKPSNHTAPVFYPDSNYSIAKYLDITKYLSMLQKNSLFFCRLDKLEDQFEGTTSKANFNDKVKLLKHLSDIGYFNSPLTEDQIINKVRGQYEVQKKFKSTFCVNCWNKYEKESAALWKIYSDFNKGIMIKSSISKLEKAFELVEIKIQLSEIHYLDHQKDKMLDGNMNYPVIHKHEAYNFEDEVRLIHLIKQSYWEMDWSKEEVEEGIYINTNLNELIEEVVIGPYSPKWFYELIQNISDKYKLNKPIKKSLLCMQE